VPNHAWEDRVSPCLSFSLDFLWNISTYLKNKRLISLTTYFKIYSYYYLITPVTFTYQKSSASELALVTCASSHSHLSYLLVTCFDFWRCVFEGSGSSSINSMSHVANSMSPILSDIVKFWCPSISMLRLVLTIPIDSRQIWIWDWCHWKVYL
jgi:hypothetical protein